MRPKSRCVEVYIKLQKLVWQINRDEWSSGHCFSVRACGGFAFDQARTLRSFVQLKARSLERQLDIWFDMKNLRHRHRTFVRFHQNGSKLPVPSTWLCKLPAGPSRRCIASVSSFCSTLLNSSSTGDVERVDRLSRLDRGHQPIYSWLARQAWPKRKLARSSQTSSCNPRAVSRAQDCSAPSAGAFRRAEGGSVSLPSRPISPAHFW